MKKSVVLILLFFAALSNCYSQSGWTKIYACDNLGIGVHFFNQSTGYLINQRNVFKSTNSGTNWSSALTLTATYNVSSGFYFDENNYILTGWDNSHIFGWIGVCKNGVRTDSYLSPILSNLGITTTHWINIDVGYAGGTDLGSSSYIGRAFRTTNGGANWIEITPSGSLYINCIKFLNANTGFIINPFLKKTTNMGANWIAINDTSGLDMHIVNSDTVYICGYGGRVNISTNGGMTWAARNAGVNFDINRIKFINSKTGWICGSNGTIMRTSNAGVNWQMQLSAGTAFLLRDIYVLNQNFLWASGDSGTVRGVVFKTSTGGSSFVNSIPGNIPSNYKLFQNYPNPFNQTSIFKFQCSMKGHVNVSVYDITGREVRTLVNETLQPGTYEVRFDGSELNSGVYFYKFTINDFQEIRKMVMIK
ncbi:MAG TPA: T9SS type A sorting domain-containing protein [Ignavibacteria bacterium]|nr:T9SS type A sorting domain-containing protein [Ignavibacteria bacterium]